MLGTMDPSLPAAPPPVDRLIAVNAHAALLAALEPLGEAPGTELIAAENEAELIANLVHGSAVVLVGLAAHRLSPLSVLRALAHARRRPAVVLVGAVEPRLYRSIEQLASRLELDALAHVIRADDAARLAASFLHNGAAQVLPSEPDLRRAIEQGELTLHYQPKFACDDERLVLAVEALVRWRHPTLGLLRPHRFLPLAESTGLLGDLTDFTITEAVRQQSVWAAHGLDVPVAVNLAQGLIRDAGFPDRLASCLLEYGVSPQRLTLEVKESGEPADRELISDVLGRLRLAGVGIALDDYGTGVSSLTELYQLPFTELKVDRALIADAPAAGAGRTVLRGIVRLANELGIEVCGEGVETRA